MIFTQKIYFNDKLLILTTDKNAYINENAGAEYYGIYAGASVANIGQAVQELERSDTKGAIMEDVSEDALLRELRGIYKPLDAAGGVAFNEKGEILLIFRRGKWDLPKGKLDDGEKIDECALREVSEETGLKNPTLDGKICDTYHIYTQNNDRLLKRTAWYKMRGNSRDKLKPQKEENILDARWVNRKDIGPLAAKSYEAVREVLRAVGLSW